jgi:hypothetical protein
MDSPYITRYEGDAGDVVADRTVSTAGSYNVTGTNSANFWVLQMVTFKGTY